MSIGGLANRRTLDNAASGLPAGGRESISRSAGTVNEELR
jgi:hypothetical protein